MALTKFEQAGAALALSACFFGGCSKSQDSSASQNSSPGYTQIDENTYLIDGWESGAVLGENLAKFRNEVPGDFILVLHDSRHAISSDALAIRYEAPTPSGGINRIVGVLGGSGGAK